MQLKSGHYYLSDDNTIIKIRFFLPGEQQISIYKPMDNIYLRMSRTFLEKFLIKDLGKDRKPLSVLYGIPCV